MPVPVYDYVPRPFAQARYTPDTSRLASIYAATGQQLNALTLQRGAQQGATLDRLGSILSGAFEGARVRQAQKEALAIRKAEQAAARAFEAEQKRLEREERQAERDEAKREREEAVAYRRGADAAEEVGHGPMSETQMGAVLGGPAAGRARYVFGPGTADGPELQPTQSQQRGIEAERAITEMGGTIGPNGQVIMPPRPTAARGLDLQPAMVNGQRTFVRFNPDTGETLDFSGRPVNAQPIPPAATTTQEPLVAVVGPDGRPVLVPRSDAAGKQPAAGSMKPATGMEKRALAFFNRADQADKDLEALEADIQKLGFGNQVRLEHFPNWMQSEQGQMYRQAQRAFTEARLRKDSGAAIPEQEFENDRMTYFAQPGDSTETLAQKRRGRAAVLASLANESGQALGEFIGSPEEAAAMVQSFRQRSRRDAEPPSDGVERWERGPDGKPRRVRR